MLAQVSSDRTDYRFPLAIYQGVSAANLEVTVRFKAGAGQVDRAGDIAVRLSDPDNYYVVRTNALGTRPLRAQGRPQPIQGFRTRVSSEAWHVLGLRAEGDRLAVSFDGKPLFTAARPDLLQCWQARALDQGRQHHPFRRAHDSQLPRRPTRDHDHERDQLVECRSPLAVAGPE